MKKIALFFCIITVHLQAWESVLVGISGGTGSGKTTLAYQLLDYFSDEAVLISQDSYYKDLSYLPMETRGAINFDHPDALDFVTLKEHMIALKNGQTIIQPIYDFVTHSRLDQTLEIHPKKLVLVEGILLLAVPEICELFDLTIFIDTDDDIRLLRRLERDVKERGRDFESVKQQYLTTVKPMHEMYVHPSKGQADVVVSGMNENFPVVTGLIYGFLSTLTK